MTSLPLPPSSVSLPSPPGDGVVAVATVDRKVDERCEAISGGEDVIAAVHVEHKIFSGADVKRERGWADAVETHAAAIWGERENFGGIAAIDLGGVGAVPALEYIAAVARIPDHPVVAGVTEHLIIAGAAGQCVVAVAAMQHIVPSLAEQDVVAVLAEQQIVARAAGDRVVTRSAEQLGGWQRTVSFVERNGVVARLTEHLNHRGVTDGGLAAVDANGAVVDENSPRRVAADDNAIVEAVTNDEQRAGAWGKRCVCNHNVSPSKDITPWEGYLRADRMTGLKASFRGS